MAEHTKPEKADPFVSIVINNYNYGRFLAQAIDSALAQTYERCEVIVVDDGSTDDSAQICGRYVGKIHGIFKPNGGQGSACNAGFAAARGDLIQFLDADDVLMPDAVAAAAKAFGDHPDASCLHGPMIVIDEAGQRIGTYPEAPLGEGDIRAKALEYGPWAWRVQAMSGNFWPRRVLEQVLPMPESRFRLGADIYLQACTPLRGNLVRLEHPVAQYRRHGNNAWQSSRMTLKDVAMDLECFDQFATTLEDEARKAGCKVNPDNWRNHDWRHQVRCLLLNGDVKSLPRPDAQSMLRALGADQTRPWKKAALMPVLAILPHLPPGAGRDLGLRLLAR